MAREGELWPGHRRMREDEAVGGVLHDDVSGDALAAAVGLESARAAGVGGAEIVRDEELELLRGQLHLDRLGHLYM